MIYVPSTYCHITIHCDIPLLQAQYSFIHDALDEFLTCGDTSIAVTNIRVAMVNLSKHEEGSLATGYHAQFEVRLGYIACLHM